MNLAVISDTLASMIRIATPLMLMALGGLLCQRAGVFNIALEGFSLVGAFAAIAVYLLCFEVSEAKKKAIALAGVLYIIYVGLYFSVHQSLAMMGLINIGNLMKNDGAIYAVIAVKVLLVAAAVVFLLLGEKKQNETAELAEEPAAEEAATPAEPVEEEKPVEETQEPEPAE